MNDNNNQANTQLHPFTIMYMISRMIMKPYEGMVSFGFMIQSIKSEEQNDFFQNQYSNELVTDFDWSKF